MARTDQILDVIRRALAARRVEIDEAGDLRGVVVDLKFRPGAWVPRAIVVHLEHETVLDPKS